jgi:hypothetical protein
MMARPEKKELVAVDVAEARPAPKDPIQSDSVEPHSLADRME